jgi:hypothetical protein
MFSPIIMKACLYCQDRHHCMKIRGLYNIVVELRFAVKYVLIKESPSLSGSRWHVTRSLRIDTKSTSSMRNDQALGLVINST